MTIPLAIVSFAVGLGHRTGRGAWRACRRISSSPTSGPVLHLGHPRHPTARAVVHRVLCTAAVRGEDSNRSPPPSSRFSINVGGYAAEIIRSAIQSIPKGQWEAAETIGLNYTAALRRIILPQAARVAVPPLSNTLISLVKDTSLASIDPGHRAVPHGADHRCADLRVLCVSTCTAAAYYWVICLALSFGQSRLERRLERYVAR